MEKIPEELQPLAVKAMEDELLEVGKNDNYAIAIPRNNIVVQKEAKE